MAFSSWWEHKLHYAGIKLHVSFHASERILYDFQPKKPIWNEIPPPLKSDIYRCVSLRDDGSTQSHCYFPKDCKHRDAEALCLRWFK